MRDWGGGLYVVVEEEGLRECEVEWGFRAEVEMEVSEEEEEGRRRLVRERARLGFVEVEVEGKEEVMVEVGVREAFTKREERFSFVLLLVLGSVGGECEVEFEVAGVARMGDIFVVVVLRDGVRFRRRAVMSFASAGR